MAGACRVQRAILRHGRLLAASRTPCGRLHDAPTSPSSAIHGLQPAPVKLATFQHSEPESGRHLLEALPFRTKHGSAALYMCREHSSSSSSSKQGMDQQQEEEEVTQGTSSVPTSTSDTSGEKEDEGQANETPLVSPDKPAEPDELDFARQIARKMFILALVEQVSRVSATADGEFLKQAMNDKFDDCWKRHHHRAVPGSYGPVVASCLVVMATKVAGPWLGRDPDAFRELLKELLGGGSGGIFGFVHRTSLFFRRNKLSFVGELMDKTQRDWGPAFDAHRLSAPGREEVSVTRCCYYDIFVEEGTPELTFIFCALERQWFDTLNLNSHSIEFSVPSTIAAGQKNCLFMAVETKEQQ